MSVSKLKAAQVQYESVRAQWVRFLEILRTIIAIEAEDGVAQNHWECILFGKYLSVVFEWSADDPDVGYINWGNNGSFKYLTRIDAAGNVFHVQDEERCSFSLSDTDGARDAIAALLLTLSYA